MRRSASVRFWLPALLLAGLLTAPFPALGDGDALADRRGDLRPRAQRPRFLPAALVAGRTAADLPDRRPEGAARAMARRPADRRKAPADRTGGAGAAGRLRAGRRADPHRRLSLVAGRKGDPGRGVGRGAGWFVPDGRGSGTRPGAGRPGRHRREVLPGRRLGLLRARPRPVDRPRRRRRGAPAHPRGQRDAAPRRGGLGLHRGVRRAHRLPLVAGRPFHRLPGDGRAERPTLPAARRAGGRAATVELPALPQGRETPIRGCGSASWRSRPAAPSGWTGHAEYVPRIDWADGGDPGRAAAQPGPDRAGADPGRPARPGAPARCWWSATSTGST